MHSDKLPAIDKAAAVIRDVIGCEFEWETPGKQYTGNALMVLLHEPGSALRAYCNYDCNQYDKIDRLSDALRAIGMMVEDKTGDYSGVYELELCNDV